MTDIFIKPDKPAEVYFPAMMVWPRTGDYTLRCGNCQSYNFKVHIKPSKYQQAQVTELICTVCLKCYPLDDKSMVAGGGGLKSKERAIKMNGGSKLTSKKGVWKNGSHSS